jgi:hypothetical protein
MEQEDSMLPEEYDIQFMEFQDPFQLLSLPDPSFPSIVPEIVETYSSLFSHQEYPGPHETTKTNAFQTDEEQDQ